MILISSDIHIREDELQFKFVRSTGPGGQNVNKVATAVQLRFDVMNSPSLTDRVKKRLLITAKNRMNDRGELIIEAKQHRTQHQNRKDAIDRLINQIKEAATTPKTRKPTKPTKSSQRKRLEKKHQRGKLKIARKKVIFDKDQD